MEQYFEYGEKETEYLKSKDKKLGMYIDMLGHVNRPLDGDIFSSVVRSIIGQQISTKAQKTICIRMSEELGDITPKTICSCSAERIQSLGTTFRKAEYILEFADKVMSGVFPLSSIKDMSDKEAIKALSSLRGIGVWTAEMMLLHSLQRPDILSYGDLAILRGMRMVYRHREITRERFERLRRRYSPYGSVASIYLWKISSGVIPDLTDPASDRKCRNIHSKDETFIQ